MIVTDTTGTKNTNLQLTQPPPRTSVTDYRSYQSQSTENRFMNHTLRPATTTTQPSYWIMVFGFDPTLHSSTIQDRFRSYGVISDQFSCANWICIHYKSHLSYEKALCQKDTLHQEIFIGVKPLDVGAVGALRRIGGGDVGRGSSLSMEDVFLDRQKHVTVVEDESILLGSEENKDSSLERDNEMEAKLRISGSIVGRSLAWIFNWDY